MVMNRLVTFGCSHTAGTGLENKEDSWTFKLASKFNISLVNKGLPGNSIKGTAHTFSEFNFKDGDMGIVMWPGYSRYTILEKAGFHMLLPNAYGFTDRNNNWVESDSSIGLANSNIFYKNFYNEYDAIKTSEMYIRYVDNLATIEGIQLIHTFADNLIPYFKDNEVDILSFIKNKYITKTFWTTYYENFKISDDDYHINKEGQSLWADFLYNELTGKKPLI